MIYLRFFCILLLILAFILVGLPLDALAQRLNWSIRPQIPLVFHRILIRILQIHVQRRGEICEHPAILVPNHVSWTDISVIGALAGVWRAGQSAGLGLCRPGAAQSCA